MSLSNILELTENLPPAIRERVIGYARSVKAQVGQILEDARIRRTSDIEDKIVFLAGVKKIEAIISSAEWSMRTTQKLLVRSDTDAILIAGQNFSSAGPAYQDLLKLKNELRTVLSEQNILHLVHMSYQEIAQELSNGH